MGAFDDLIPTSKPGAVLPFEPNRGYFGDLIPEKPSEPETVGQVRGFFGALQRGVKAIGDLPDTIALANRSGLDDSGIAQYRAHRIGQLAGESGPEVIYRTQREAAERVARNIAENEAMPRSEAQQRLERAKGWREQFAAWLRDPVELTASIVAESLPASVAGAVGGGLVGGPVGAVAGVGLSSGLMTFSSELLGNAANRGVDLRNPDAIGEWLRSDAYQKDADSALTKAVTVGAIDAGTAGFAGRFVVPAIRTGLMRNIAVASAKELGVQAGAGAGGEALGSLAAGQKIDPFNVFAEAIAEVGSGPAEVAGNFRARSKGIRSRYRAPEVPRSEPILQPINEPQERPAVQVPVQPVSTVTAAQAVEATPVVREEAPIDDAEYQAWKARREAEGYADTSRVLFASQKAAQRGGESVERQKERQEVLADSGAASVAPVSKEPWQMTYEQLVASDIPSLQWGVSLYGEGSTGKATLARKLEGIKSRHRKIVQEAIDSGKQVPTEVLADYPDLANAPQTPISRPTGGTADRPVQAAVESPAVVASEVPTLKSVMEIPRSSGTVLGQRAFTREGIQALKGEQGGKHIMVAAGAALKQQKPMAVSYGGANASVRELGEMRLQTHNSTIDVVIPTGESSVSVVRLKTGATPDFDKWQSQFKARPAKAMQAPSEVRAVPVEEGKKVAASFQDWKGTQLDSNRFLTRNFDAKADEFPWRVTYIDSFGNPTSHTYHRDSFAREIYDETIGIHGRGLLQSEKSEQPTTTREPETQAEVGKEVGRVQKGAPRKSREARPDELKTPEEFRSDRNQVAKSQMMAPQSVAEAADNHQAVILQAERQRKPISAAAVESYGVKLTPGYVREGDAYVWRENQTKPTFTKGERVITSDYGPGVVESVLPNRIRVLPDSGGKAIGVNPKRVRKAEAPSTAQEHLAKLGLPTGEKPAQSPSTAQAKMQEEPATPEQFTLLDQPATDKPVEAERVQIQRILNEIDQREPEMSGDYRRKVKPLLESRLAELEEQLASEVYGKMDDMDALAQAMNRVRADVFARTVRERLDTPKPEAPSPAAPAIDNPADRVLPLLKTLSARNVETKADVTAALTRSVSPVKRLKAQKQFLLDALDQELTTAPPEKAYSKAQQMVIDRAREAVRSTQRYLKQKYSQSESVFAERAKAEAEAGRAMRETIPHIEIEVPGDGTFTIAHTHQALREFREKVAKEFPSGLGGSHGPSQTRTTATPTPKLNQKPSAEDVRKAMASHLGTSDERIAVTTGYSNGKEMVATDGRRLIRVVGKTDGTQAKPYRFGEKFSRAEVKDHESYPDFTQVLPKESERRYLGAADTGQLWHWLRQAELMTTAKNNSVQLWRNKDGSFGVSSNSPDLGESYHNVLPDAERIGSFNPNYLIDAMESARALGNERVDFYGTDAGGLGVFILRGASHENAIMPMRGGSDPDALTPSKAKPLYKPLPEAVSPQHVIESARTAVKDLPKEISKLTQQIEQHLTSGDVRGRQKLEVDRDILRDKLAAAKSKVKADKSAPTEQSGVASGEQKGSVGASNEGTQASGKQMDGDNVQRDRFESSPENEEGSEFRLRGEMPVEAMAEDLRASGKVLRGSPSEIARALPLARREAERDSVRGKGTLRAVSKRTLRNLYPRSETGSRELPADTRVFIEGSPETQLPVAQRNIDILAHGILFGANRKSGTSSTLNGINFVQRLSGRLTGLRIVFQPFTGDKKDTRAEYLPRGKGEEYDMLRVNTALLSTFDLNQTPDFDLWVSTLVEEVLHSATMRVSSRAELKAIWDALSDKEKADVRKIYGKDFQSDVHAAAEYVRMLLQDRLFGHSTEMEKRTLKEGEKSLFRQLLDLLKSAFGSKPDNELARKVIERIEGAIKGEAPIEHSILEEGGEREAFGASPEKPIADILQRGDIEDAGDEYIPTEVFGIRDKVLDKTQYTDEKRETALGVAKSVFDGAGLATTRDGDGHFQLTNTGNKDNAAGQKLVDATRKEIAKYGQGALELTELVQSLVLDFKNGRMDALFDKPIRNQLYSLAQGERSFRGVSLNALRGAGEDIKFIAQNIDVYLQRVWHEAFGGEHIDRVITKIRDNLKAFFTPEVIKEIVAANPALAKVEGAEKIVADGLATDFANLNMLRDTYADSLQKAGVPEKEAMVLAKQIIEALKPRIRLAAADAAKKVEESLTADEKTAVKGKKPIWQRIVDAVARGEFDSAPALRDKARENGWKPPSDEDVARIKRLAERERELHQLTQKEVEAAGGNQDKLRREQILRDESTLPRRLPLMRQMEAEWAAITRPVNFGRGLWRNRANNAAFLNELVSANLLLRLSFAPKQALSVLSQFLVHVPTRAIAQAIELHSQSKSLEQDTALRKDIYNSLTGAYQSSLAGFKDGMAQFVAAGKGRGEARNVDRLMSGISAIERIDAQAKAYAEQGKHGMAILFRMLSFIRLGYRIAQAFDNLHGVPSEYIEIRHQAVRRLMENGVERAAANAQADNIIESIKKNHINATVQAKAFLDAQGQKYTSEQLREISYRIARRWAYEDMRALGLPADEFMAENRGLRETIGWNEREAGTASIGGAVGEIVSKTGKVGEKIGIPLALGRFGNAIAIGINRALHFTPLGFFPGAFGDNNAWFKSELDRNQRKVEASVGTMLGSIAFMLALSGVFVVRLRWPKDKEERDLFEAQGHRPGTIEIPNGDGSFSAISMNTGLATFLAPYLAAGGALRDLLTEREGQQAKLNAEAAKKGLPAEQIRPMSFADMVGVAAQSAYQTVLGGRTAAGAVASIADYGIPNVTKVAASQTAPLIPGLPALQEMSRMGGVVLDSKLATFTDFLLPLPTSKARRVNFLGEPAGTPDDIQRIVQVLTGGSYLNVDPKQAEAQRAYSILFNTDFRPGSINPNKGYAIGNSFRPFNDAELENYTALRGQEFKQALGQLPENADIKTVRAAFRSANQRALGKMGVNSLVRKTKNRRSRGLRSRGIRSLRSRRKGIRSLRSSARYSF